MPSSSNSKQKKKQSKAQLQNSPLSSNTTTTPSRTQPQQPQEHASLCVEASRKFPSLIAESAFVAEIIHVDDIVPLFKGFRIWLSEPSMLSSSLSPGSIVSVITITVTNTFIIIITITFFYKLMCLRLHFGPLFRLHLCCSSSNPLVDHIFCITELILLILFWCEICK